MATSYEVNQQDLIEKLSEELKKVKAIQPPVWAEYVKTGMFKERPPVRNDWWYTRTASILCSVNRLGPIGVNKLRTKYGGKHRRGVAPPHFGLASGNIIRKALQQLEKAGFVKQQDKGRKGKIITPLGIKLLNQVSNTLVSRAKIAENAEKHAAKEQAKEEVAE